MPIFNRLIVASPRRWQMSKTRLNGSIGTIGFCGLWNEVRFRLADSHRIYAHSIRKRLRSEPGMSPRGEQSSRPSAPAVESRKNGDSATKSWQ